MIFIASDHAGFKLKEKIKEYLKSQRLPFIDLGTFSEQPVDYPEYGFKVAKKVVTGRKHRGIIICGTGNGICIAANRVKGARAAVVYDKYTAEMSRKHNDSNIICLRGRGFSEKKSLELLKIWLNTEFDNESRHIRRIKKIEKLASKKI